MYRGHTINKKKKDGRYSFGCILKSALMGSLKDEKVARLWNKQYTEYAEVDLTKVRNNPDKYRVRLTKAGTPVICVQDLPKSFYVVKKIEK